MTLFGTAGFGGQPKSMTMAGKYSITMIFSILKSHTRAASGLPFENPFLVPPTVSPEH